MDIDQTNQNVVSGLDAVEIKLVRKVHQVHSVEGFFKPDMCHQVFGDSESIFGYKNLKIRLFYDASTFCCYATSSFDFKVEPDMESGLEAENYMAKLNPWLPSNYFTNFDEFLVRALKKRKSGPFGRKIYNFAKQDRTFQVHMCNSKYPGYTDFHQRMETLIVWFIDAANFIDVEDDKWLYFVLYEQTKINKTTVHFPVGYATVYNYYAFPEHRRFRISQFIMFPPYQKMGLGTELLRAIYRHLHELPNTLDITVEDPSEKFQRMRDYVDAKFCMALPSFNPISLKNNFSKDMIKEARDSYKLNEKQCRRIYEILRLFYTNMNNADDFNSFKLVVKRRLNVPFKKQERINRKLKHIFKDMSALPDIQMSDHRLKFIEKDFQSLINQYLLVINRLAHV